MAKMNYFGHTHSEMREKEHRVIQTSKKKKKPKQKGHSAALVYLPKSMIYGWQKYAF